MKRSTPLAPSFPRIAPLPLLPLALVLLLGGCHDAPAPIATYSFVTAWGDSGSGPGQFREPKGVAVDAAGDVYVADAYNHRIQKFDGDGRFLLAWGRHGSGEGEFNAPWAVAIDGGGDVFVADRNNHRIQRFDASGRFKAAWGAWGRADGLFSHPRGLAVDREGGIYVVEGFSTEDNNRVQKDDGTGKFLLAWGSYGRAPGQFDFSSVTSEEEDTLPRGTLPPLTLPVLGRGPCGGLRGIAVDSRSEVFVADLGNHRIQVFDRSGRLLRTWGRHGDGRGEFIWPQGIAIGANGLVFVDDASPSRRIQFFDRTGHWLGEFGSAGSADGQFKFQPVGIAVNAAGDVYVADTGNSRIQKFARTLEGAPKPPTFPSPSAR